VPLAAAILLMPFSTLRSQTNTVAAADKPSAVSAVLQAREHEWADAVKRQDVVALDRLQATEYVFTDPAGQVWTKARQLETIKAGDLQIDSFELSDVKVQLYDSAAVVTFCTVWHGTFRSTDMSGPQRMTDVFVKRDERWQCVASQSTRIRAP
jgi:ketosteroid isomerase-like protein